MRGIVFLLATLMLSLPALAHRVVIEGGKVQMRGELVNSACAVATESQNMRIEMGQYRTNAFTGPGSFATTQVPFTLRLVDCRKDVSQTVGIAFQGLTPTEDPLVFMTTSRVDGRQPNSGVGLALFDNSQRHIIPNAQPVSYFPINDDELIFHFSARYRAISGQVMPGAIQSYVWFTLLYP